MKYMISWSVPTISYQAAIGRFLSTGAPMPEGLTCLGRWHTLGSNRGWVLVEGDDSAVAQHVTEWAGLLELRVAPVIEDAEAAAAAAKVQR